DGRAIGWRGISAASQEVTSGGYYECPQFMLQSPAMRLSPICISAVLLTAGCSTSRPPQNSVVEHLTADTPRATVEGNTFIAPAGWTLTVRGPATILQPPEEDSRIALVDVHAKDADEAVTAAWSAYGTHKNWPLKLKTESPDKDGWSEIR